MGLQILTQPAVEPLTLADAKQHLRIDNDDEDTQTSALISAARVAAENFLRRPLITTEYLWTFDGFPAIGFFDRFRSDELILRFPIGGVSEVTEVKYLDTSQQQQTMLSTAYRLDLASQPARMQPAYQTAWPATSPDIAACSVKFKAGYGTAATSIPPNVISAVKLILGHLWENREDSVLQYTSTPLPMGAEYLMWPERVHAVRRG
jgi:uncharacterized phiE125 gp8 family phage protein